MQYVEVHVELPTHPKTKRCARRLGIGVPQMVGHLAMLWLWCQRYAPDGDVSGLVPAELADGAGWEGDAQAFMDALLACGIGAGAGFLERATDDEGDARRPLSGNARAGAAGLGCHCVRW